MPYLVTLSLLGLFGKLAWWQWHKAEAKEQRLARLTALAEQGPKPLAELLAEGGELQDAQARVEGRWLPRAILWDNRTLDRRVGYDLLQPVETNAGIVLVNRGWLPAPARRSQLPELPLARGQVVLSGRLVRPEASLRLAELPPERIDGALRVQWPLPGPIAQALDLELLPVVLAPSESTDNLRPHWAPLTMSPQKHRGYALQWATMALALAIAFLYWRSKQRKTP
ncbi:SURF1 family protein [Gallaecimonas sp. GXIMD4217]|uniref:SURF1 family protein n=1 Tax=Gallaecimonas sp. GXIMD4217 TaxID=3131927 RepID=UPI00311B3504